ncbi:hypothetical protein NicSoilC5_04020 [Arthrobacter sp. NicSoilC5]|nr:hypothetical protein NicSoilC5_04020 [Arthrobacter sp. NicSoilC5]
MPSYAKWQVLATRTRPFLPVAACAAWNNSLIPSSERALQDVLKVLSPQAQGANAELGFLTQAWSSLGGTTFHPAWWKTGPVS